MYNTIYIYIPYITKFIVRLFFVLDTNLQLKQLVTYNGEPDGDESIVGRSYKPTYKWKAWIWPNDLPCCHRKFQVYKPLQKEVESNWSLYHQSIPLTGAFYVGNGWVAGGMG